MFTPGPPEWVENKAAIEKLMKTSFEQFSEKVRQYLIHYSVVLALYTIIIFGGLYDTLRGQTAQFTSSITAAALNFRSIGRLAER